MKKLAVILHVYYENQIPAIRKHLRNLKKAGIDYDLFVTTAPLSSLGCETAIKGSPASLLHHKKEHHLPAAAQVLPVPLAPSHQSYPLAGEKFCEMTTDVPQRRGAYIDVRDPTEEGLPSASQFTKFHPARGYDIGPFIATLHTLNLDDYEYILKLHTKNESPSRYTYLNHHRLNNKIWSKIMWNALLGSPEQIKQNLEIMDKDQTIGQIAPRYCLTSEPKTYAHLLPQINQELEHLGYPAIDKLKFAAGTMFLIRAKLLKPLLNYKEEDFPPTEATVRDGTLAHIIERLYGALTEAQGYRISPINHRTYPIARGILTLKRFIVQKKHTKSGKTLIKFCKIPIWQS